MPTEPEPEQADGDHRPGWHVVVASALESILAMSRTKVDHDDNDLGATGD
jgi:hypothetical protein